MGPLLAELRVNGRPGAVMDRQLRRVSSLCVVVCLLVVQAGCQPSLPVVPTAINRSDPCAVVSAVLAVRVPIHEAFDDALAGSVPESLQKTVVAREQLSSASAPIAHLQDQRVAKAVQNIAEIVENEVDLIDVGEVRCRPNSGSEATASPPSKL